MNPGKMIWIPPTRFCGIISCNVDLIMKLV